MIGQKSFATALTGGGRYALDVPVAALAGLSVAFLVYAMPGETLAELVGSTGLAALVPSAEPPLGLKARFAIGAAGAVAVFAGAFLLLRWLDRLGTRRDEEESFEMEAPRLRRRDFHPDAPPRPPIMAGHEFGEPEQDRPEPEPVAEAEPAEEIAAVSEPSAAEDEWLLDRPAPAEEPAPEPFAFPLPERAPEAVTPPPAEAPAEAPPPSGSLDDLMSRLEQGLARRRIGPADPAVPSDPVPQPGPASDDRLQSAIDSLQRLAARGD